MQIKVGKTYLTRDGLKAHVSWEKASDQIWRFVGIIEGDIETHHWNKNGFGVSRSDVDEKIEYDLVSEYIDPRLEIAIDGIKEAIKAEGISLLSNPPKNKSIEILKETLKQIKED